MTWCLISLLTEGQVELKSSYNGSTRTVKLGSSFDFSWNYTGDLKKIEWGTKDKDLIASDVLLFILARGGRHTPNISQYNGRRFAHWNQQSPGQVIFTLNPIEEVDNQVFIFRFIPVNKLAADVYDIVQLIVKGKNCYYVMNCCFIMEGSMKFWNGQVMPSNFNNFWQETTSMHTANKKKC